MKNKRFTLLSVAVLLALIVAAIMPLAAFAQDEVPPVDPPAQEQVPPVDPPVVEQPAVDAAPATEAVVTDAPAADAVPAGDLTIPAVLEQLPEDTSLVVLDAATGAEIPLASQEAAAAVSPASDPFFKDTSLNGGAGGYVGYITSGNCPAQVTVCNTGYANPIQAAVDAFKANPNATEYIYIESGTYTGDVTINAGGGSFNNLKGLIGQGSGTTTINGNITINDLATSAFTLEGFTVHGSVIAMNPTVQTLNLTDIKQDGGRVVPDGLAIMADHVNLTDVSAENNTKSGLIVSATKTTVVNGSFGNIGGGTGTGLSIAGGIATITGARIYDSNIGVDTSLGNTNAVDVYCSNFSGIVSSNVGTSVTDHGSSTGCGAIGQSPVGLPFVPTYKSATTSTPGNNPDPRKPICEQPNPPAYCKTVLGDDAEKIVPVAELFEQGGLPGDLPKDTGFAAGFDITLHLGSPEGKRVSQADDVTITVDIPAEMQGKPLRVMFWDGSAWVEVKNATLSADGKQITFTVAQEGKYALVTP